jgi:hypothetical protein
MKPLAALTLLLLVACATTPRNPEAWMERQINACLPTAIAFREGLRKHDVWSEVLMVRWTENDGTPKGHAYAVYLYPKGANKLWTYDSWGSYRARAFTNDPMSIARIANQQRGSGTKGLFAEYLK